MPRDELGQIFAMQDPDFVKEVVSPITGAAGIDFVREIKCVTLIAEYKRVLGIDISYLLGDQRDLALLRCRESGYRFYYPHTIVGDGAFYHHLEANDWYYMPSKWEFDEAIKFLHGNCDLLEIGSGRGDFINRVTATSSRISCTGLELNVEAALAAQARGLNVVVESSANHAKTHSAFYDVVAAFQVLEHIANPIEVLRDAVAMIKPSGLLIVGVPDNSERHAESIFVKSEAILNMPPHHQGLWDVPSLAFLPRVLPVRLEQLMVEPAIMSHHSNGYRGLIKEELIRRYGGFFGLGAYIIGRPFYNHALRQLNKYLPAHSVLAVFRRSS